MPEYLSPAVYVEEINLGSKPIEGVSTSTAGFVGIAERGPVNLPVLVTNFGEYQRSFGGFLDELTYKENRWLPFAVDGFFANGGKRAYVLRVGPTNLEAGSDQPTNVAQAILPDRGGSRRSLGQPARAGDQEIDPDHWAGIAKDTVLVIGDGDDAEAVQVTGFAERIQVQPALARAHAAGAGVTLRTVASAGTSLDTAPPNAVGASNIQVQDPSPLTAKAAYFLMDGAQTEVIQVGDMTGDIVAVASPLRFSHAAGVGLQQAVLASQGGAPATLAAAVAKGATSLPLSALTGLNPGDWVHIPGASPDQDESVQLAGPFPTGSAPFTVNLASGVTLQFAHPSAVEVRPTTPAPAVATVLAAPTKLRLKAAAGLKTNDLALLDSGANGELVQLKQTSAAGGKLDVTLAAPLRFVHAANAPVVPLAAPDETTHLTQSADRRDTQITLASIAGLQAGDVLELADGPQTEYAQVKTTPSGSGAQPVSLVGGLRYPHTATPPTPVRRLRGTLQVFAGPNDPDPKRHPEIGRWGNDILIRVQSTPTVRGEIQQPAATTDRALTLTSAQGIEEGSVLRLPGNQYVVVSRVEGNRVFLVRTVPAEISAADVAPTQPDLSKKQVVSLEFAIRFTHGLVDEFHRNLSMDPRHSRYFAKIINRDSALVHVADLNPPGSSPATAQAALLQQPLSSAGWHPAGGDDGLGSLTPELFVGHDAVDADERTGLFALNNRTDIAIVAVPGQSDQTIQNGLIIHAERARYRIAVLDPEQNARLDQVQKQRTLHDSKYAALYYPWIQIFDPVSKQPVFAPPSGHICGVYAGTDAAVGVHKAPANVVVSQALDLKFTITQGQQDVLNPLGINAIRAFPNRGIRVWGARTISSDPAWRYVNVRRLFIFLEHSIDEATQYAVFEPNDVPLWERLRGSVTAFLTTQWRAGMLQGRTAQEAFFVKVGLGETMTQDDIDNGRVIMLIGVAPVKPAEFVIFRITQMPRGATQ